MSFQHFRSEFRLKSNGSSRKRQKAWTYKSVYLGSSVVLVLENVSDLAECRNRPPAGFHFARSRHAVALALHFHVILNRLYTVHAYQQSRHLSMRDGWLRNWPLNTTRRSSRCSNSNINVMCDRLLTQLLCRIYTKYTRRADVYEKKTEKARHEEVEIRD